MDVSLATEMNKTIRVMAATSILIFLLGLIHNHNFCSTVVTLMIRLQFLVRKITIKYYNCFQYCSIGDIGMGCPAQRCSCGSGRSCCPSEDFSQGICITTKGIKKAPAGISAKNVQKCLSLSGITRDRG